jgi:hypothetical protein
VSEKKSGVLYGIGGVTLLTVLLVLCLTLFSVLALSSAQADRRLSEKNAAMVTAYYEVDNMTVRMMSQAEQIWPAGDARPALSEFTSRLKPDFDVYIEPEGDGLLFSAEIPVMETQRLQLSLRLTSGMNQERWEVRSWRLLPPEQNEADIAFLHLWQP